MNNANRHFRQRANQRAVQEKAIIYALEFGRQVICAGVVHHFIGRMHYPLLSARGEKGPEHFNGIVVLSDSRSGRLITTYKNKNALKRIRRKRKCNNTN